jgi:hypothetical protein
MIYKYIKMQLDALAQGVPKSLGKSKVNNPVQYQTGRNEKKKETTR